MKTSGFTDSQSIAFLEQAQAGSPKPSLCREHRISNATFHKWRTKIGDMDASFMARLIDLDEKNRRLETVQIARICRRWRGRLRAR